MKSLACYISVILIISGCSSTYHQRVVTDTPSRLENNKGVFISTPDNGYYGSTQYQGSGQMTADAVKAVFLKHTDHVHVTTKCHGGSCFKMIPIDKYQYYVQPNILHWEDRATEWSGKKDVLEIKITIYDAITKEALSSAVLSGKSKWGTFGGDHPQDLLAEPINDYVESLY
jgi:hypothetical protein